jgi:hypothetical protein
MNDSKSTEQSLAHRSWRGLTGLVRFSINSFSSLKKIANSQVVFVAPVRTSKIGRKNLVLLQPRLLCVCKLRLSVKDPSC